MCTALPVPVDIACMWHTLCIADTAGWEIWTHLQCICCVCDPTPSVRDIDSPAVLCCVCDPTPLCERYGLTCSALLRVWSNTLCERYRLTCSAFVACVTQHPSVRDIDSPAVHLLFVSKTGKTFPVSTYAALWVNISATQGCHTEH